MSLLSDVANKFKISKAFVPVQNEPNGEPKPQPADRMPHMTEAAYRSVPTLTEMLKGMTAKQLEGALLVLQFLHLVKNGAGYKRLFNYTVPTALKELSKAE